MSKEFINVEIKIDYEEKKKQEANGKFEGNCTLNLLRGELRNSTFTSVVDRGLLIAYDSRDYCYIKGLAECSINLLCQVMSNFDKGTISYDNRKTKDDMDVELANQVRLISELLQWIVNSKSWRDAEYTSFDAVEIELKLKHIMGMCGFHQKE